MLKMRPIISLFKTISADVQDELVAEGKRLLRWLEDDADAFVVAFVD